MAASAVGGCDVLMTSCRGMTSAARPGSTAGLSTLSPCSLICGDGLEAGSRPDRHLLTWHDTLLTGHGNDKAEEAKRARTTATGARANSMMEGRVEERSPKGSEASR